MECSPPCQGGGRGFKSRRDRATADRTLRGTGRHGPGSSVGTSVRLKIGRSAVRPRPWPPLRRCTRSRLRVHGTARSGGEGPHVVRARPPAATSSSLVHSPRVVRTPRPVPRYRGPRRPVASEAQPLGHPATHHHGAPHGRGEKRDPGVRRRRAEPRHPGDERLGRRRAVVVAQPPSGSRSTGRARRRPAHGRGTRR